VNAREYATDDGFVDAVENRLDRSVARYLIRAFALVIAAGIFRALGASPLFSWILFGAAFCCGLYLSGLLIYRVTRMRRLRGLRESTPPVTIADDTLTLSTIPVPWEDIADVHILDYRTGDHRELLAAGLDIVAPICLDVVTRDQVSYHIELHPYLSEPVIDRLLADLRATAHTHDVPVTVARNPVEDRAWRKGNGGGPRTS